MNPLCTLHTTHREAAAGSWQLRLAEGRSNQMFDIIDGDLRTVMAARRTERGKTAPQLPSKPVLIQSLAGKHSHLLLRKKEKYRGQNVLAVWQPAHHIMQHDVPPAMGCRCAVADRQSF